MDKNKSCEGCTERRLGCHSSCDGYKTRVEAKSKINRAKYVYSCSFPLPHRKAESEHALRTHKHRK